MTSHTSIDDAVGTMVSVAAGETLYMLCPAAWMEGNSVKLEDNAKNKFSFFYEKDAATLPGYVIYNTQVWDARNIANTITIPRYLYSKESVWCDW